MTYVKTTGVGGTFLRWNKAHYYFDWWIPIYLASHTIILYHLSYLNNLQLCFKTRCAVTLFEYFAYRCYVTLWSTTVLVCCNKHMLVLASDKLLVQLWHLPSGRSSIHSNVISNWKGFPKGLGLSRTATFNTCTFAIVVETLKTRRLVKTNAL